MKWGRGGSAKLRRRGGAPYEGPLSVRFADTSPPPLAGARNPSLESVAGAAPPSVLPDISPHVGEIGRHHSFRQSPTSPYQSSPNTNLPKCRPPAAMWV